MVEDVKKILIDYYKNSTNVSDAFLKLDENTISDLKYIISRIASNKGVYTVLVTLALYKTLHPNQDIRNHKIELPGGFSGRSFDTKYVTPTLKELQLPAMAESGWLTRSLEQAYPFDMNFKGKITPPELKISFLKIVSEVNKSKESSENILRILLNGGIKLRESNRVKIMKISNSNIQISIILDILKKHFNLNYNTHGGSKLPVLAFYSIYSILINELGRFAGSKLLPLGSHTASDRTSSSAGDIEVSKDGLIYEALEIKLNKPITPHMVRVAYEKINKFGVSRYYILSGVPPLPEDSQKINSLIFEILSNHGCQVIVNGLYDTLKYYLRLISNPNEFMNRYIKLVESDNELELIHKESLLKILQEFNLK